MSIEKKIKTLIGGLGSINIQDFVEISNFDDEKGFYNLIENEKIGRNGHFITTPEISSIFGFCLCEQFLSKFPLVNKVHLLEMGPGNGLLTKDIWHYLNQKKIEISQISLLERSKYFEKKIQNSMPYSCQIFKNLNEVSFNDDEVVFIYSNEFFDAFGSRQFIYSDHQFYEIKITYKDGKFQLIRESTELSNYILRFYSDYTFKDGEIIEHSYLILNLLENLKRILNQDFYFTATDYGYNSLPKTSTLRLISNQQKINLFECFEGVDYSFSVNFELIKKIFKSLDPVITSQKNLINNFLTEDIRDIDKESFNRAHKMITSSEFENMGDIFLNISFGSTF